MRDNELFVHTPQNGGQMYFTEIGVYKALMKSNKPIAEEFQIKVCQILKKIR